MKKFLLLLCLAPLSLFSQPSPIPQILYVTSAPTGACTVGQPFGVQIVVSTLATYSCQGAAVGGSGTWVQLAGGGVTGVSSVTGTAPLSFSPTTGAVAGTITQSGTASDGWLSAADWNSFNNNQTGIPVNHVTNGCGVQYISGLIFNVGTPCNYNIAGVSYSIASNTQLTLAAADPTQDRIDVIAVDNAAAPNGEAIIIEGTPGTPPAEPSVDPTTQLGLVFVYVAANATTPTNFTTVTIYDENTEWTCTASTHFNCASTTNPYHLTKDIEATTAGIGNNVTLVDPASGTVNLLNYNTLNFYIRSKAQWPTGNGANAARSLNVSWLNGSTPVGNTITVRDGTFGFTSALTTGYQLISIPVTAFATSSNLLTTLKFTVSGTAGTTSIGFYLDWVQLQAGQQITLPTTLMNFKGAWSASASYNVNDTVVSGGVGYVALVANTNVAVTTTSTWAALGKASLAFSGITTGTNTTATMTVGTGGTITFTGTGVNNANQLNGTAFAGTSGHLVSFGAANIPADSSIVATSVPIIVAKGTLTLATGAISSGTCTAAQTATATGALDTDNLSADFNADPTGTTGWAPSANGGLFLYKYITADTVNVKVCNNTSASVTPGAALTLQWRVIR